MRRTMQIFRQVQVLEQSRIEYLLRFGAVLVETNHQELHPSAISPIGKKGVRYTLQAAIESV